MYELINTHLQFAAAEKIKTLLAQNKTPEEISQMTGINVLVIESLIKKWITRDSTDEL